MHCSLIVHTVTQRKTACPTGTVCEGGFPVAMAACRQLQQVVMKLVKESFGDTYYDKALDCLLSLREEGIKVSRGGGRG